MTYNENRIGKVFEWRSVQRECPVKIDNGVWIGGGAIILPGITIGENSVIGAGSVVTHCIPANSVAVGNPCRVIRHIDNEDHR